MLHTRYTDGEKLATYPLLLFWNMTDYRVWRMTRGWDILTLVYLVLCSSALAAGVQAVC